jgi:hypothetical protein
MTAGTWGGRVPAARADACHEHLPRNTLPLHGAGARLTAALAVDFQSLKSKDI